MNAYPPELRTPPLPLVAFVGLPECHKEVGSYFSQTLRPPLVSVGVAEANEHVLARLFGPRKSPAQSLGPPAGILKADWFVKHRQRKAAVAIAFVNRCDVEGDPNAWNKLLFQLRIVREATNARAAGFVVVIVQEFGSPELPADRSTAICQHLNLEHKHMLSLTKVDMTAVEASQAAHDADLKAIGKLVVEQAVAYYTNETARIQQKLADRTALNGSCPLEVRCRTAFKLGVLCEFRQDWASAVSQYQAAYNHLSDLFRSQTYGWQRHAEITRVAEQVQFKICMLLLHQQRMDEALTQFRTHMGNYLNPPGPVPAAALSSHLAWVARQYAAAAEMIRPRMQECAPEQQDCHPAYLQLAAADTAIRRRCTAMQAHSSRSGQHNIPPAAVKKGAYVGQLLLRTDEGTRSLSDPEYLSYLEVEESKVNHSQLTLELLNTCLMHFKDTKHERMRGHVGVLMAQEHLAANNLLPAYKLLLQVAHAYRRDGWDTSLVSVLMRLCECAKRLKLVREYLTYSLEVTALPNALGTNMITAVATEALNSMLTGTHNIKTSIMKKTTDTNSRRATVEEGQEASGSPPASIPPPLAGFHYIVEHLDLKAAQRRWRDKEGSKVGVAELMQKHHQQDSGWARCLTLTGGFDTQAKDPMYLDYCVALHSYVPVKVRIERVELKLVDEQGECSLHASPGMPSTSTPVQQLKTVPLAAGPASPRSRSSSLQPSSLASPRTPLDNTPTPQNKAAGSSSDARTSRPETSSSSTAEERSRQLEVSSSGNHGADVGSLQLELLPNIWTHLCVRIQPRQLGKVKVEQVCIHLSKHGSVTYRINTFPAGQTLPWRLQQQELHPFRRWPSVQVGMHTHTVQHIGELPQLDVRWPELCLAGDFVRVEVRITVQQPLLKADLEVALKGLEGLASIHLTLQREEDAALVSLKCEGQRLSVPPVSPASPGCVYLWLVCTKPGKVALNTSLLCPAAVSQTSQIEFVAPFQYSTRFHAESNVHTLALPSRTTGAPLATGAPLTIGQPCLLLVSITAIQSALLELVGAYMEMDPESGLQVLGDLQQQLRQAGGSVMKKADTYTLLLHVCPTKVEPAISMGVLHLRWKRRSERGDEVHAREQQRLQEMLTGPPPSCVSPPEVVDTGLELPVVWVAEGLLSVRVVCPAHATSGLGFNLQLQLHNFTPVPQEVVLSVIDAHGFVVTGERRHTLLVPPRDQSSAVWLLVHQTSGQQPLPAVRVVAVRHNCAVVTASAHVHILPF